MKYLYFYNNYNATGQQTETFFGVTQISFGPFLCRTEETAGSLGGRGEEDVGGEQSCQQLQRLLTMFDGKIEFTPLV